MRIVSPLRAEFGSRVMCSRVIARGSSQGVGHRYARLSGVQMSTPAPSTCQSRRVPLSTGDFVEVLLARVPELRAMFDEHLAYHDEILLHVFVAEVRDVAIDAFDNGERDLSNRISVVFDAGLRDGDETVENAVAVSFVEDTPWWSPDRADFIASWPAALRAEADRWRSEAEQRG
ncbi:MAG TPA: hypothetical protein VFN21_05165, partial [Acidimicrobiales bacterium]|nr:hypothetical protein [Acidimicrobiales bacterium]